MLLPPLTERIFGYILQIEQVTERGGGRLFKLIIADDDVRIREGLSRVVDWGALGFRLAGCYGDGQQVLEHLERDHVDVVLTDIKMNRVSGLEVARTIQDRFPNTVCVLVSAYQEFDFAHQAIALGVKDYLFKPTRIADIRRVFSGIARDLEQESEQLEQADRRQKRYEEMNELWRTQFLYDLYMGTLRTQEQISALASRYDGDQPLGPALFFRFSLTGEKEGWEETQDVLQRMFHGQEQAFVYDPVMIEPERLEALAVLRDASLDAESRARKRMEELRTQAEEMAGIHMTLLEVQPFESLAAFAARPRKRLGPEQIQQTGVLSPEAAEGFLAQQRLLLSYLSAGNMDQAHTLAEEIVGQLENLPLLQQKLLMVDLVARLEMRLQALGLITPALPLYDGLMRAGDARAIQGWFQERINDWRRQFPPIQTTESVIVMLKRLVQDRYASAISLDMAAETVFLSPVYVSRLFKQETGQNFSDYVANVRFEKAKALLRRSDIRIFDVGQRTGYANPRYFYRVFKQMSGYTPSEYRRLFGAEGAADDAD